MASAICGDDTGAVAVACLLGRSVFSSDGSRSSTIRVSDSVTYTVLYKIGAGANGTVYAAVRSPGGQQVSKMF